MKRGYAALFGEENSNLMISQKVTNSTIDFISCRVPVFNSYFFTV